MVAPSEHVADIDTVHPLGDAVERLEAVSAMHWGIPILNWRTPALDEFANRPIDAYRTLVTAACDALACTSIRVDLPGLCTTEEGRVKRQPERHDPTGHGTLASFHGGCSCDWCCSHAREGGCLCEQCIKIRAGSPYVEHSRGWPESPPARP